jgi:hypothetical protein
MNWTKLIEKIAKALHLGTFKPEDLNDEMVAGYADELYQGAKESYTRSFGANSVAGVDQLMLDAIKQNVFLFSGFKTYAELSEWSMRLLTEDGKIKPFNQFLKEVKMVNQTYREAYLKSEYNHAVASAQSISNYQQLMSQTEAVPMWEMDVVMDDRTRHAKFDLIRKRFDDPFWKTHFPPMAWGCRCRVRASLEDTETDIDVNKLPELDPMFRNNPGTDGIIFPQQHPYYDVAKTKKKTIEKNAMDIYKLNSK